MINEVNREIERLEKMLITINKFKERAPGGSLKYQKKGREIFFYQQYKNEESNKWENRYIKREELALAKDLAQKYSLPVIDLHTVAINNAECHISDGVHFNAVGYELLAKCILENITKYFSE